ncbi:major yolk protein-like [Diadema antillarum]|uniref:major yolk protein-like n=1 Tax=Diadema antillarum TaxID=105358 RepID=UPI003A83DB03
MRVALLLCLVAAAHAVPPLYARDGLCPTEAEVQDPERLLRCTGYDWGCPGVKKCCQVGELQVCVDPVPVQHAVQRPMHLVKNLTEEEFITMRLRETRDFLQKLERYSTPPLEKITVVEPDTIRWCVSSPCQMKKCQRMVNEFTYKSQLTPKKIWSCVKAESQEQCMFWIERGWADIMTTRGEEVYVANTTFKLEPIAYEKTIKPQEQEVLPLKHYQNVTFALKMSHQIAPMTWSEIRDKTTCHAGADFPASFKAPVCRLIAEEVINKTGDYAESVAEFVEESCVPGILNKTYNKNMTYPMNLVSLCEKDQLKYSGVEGSLKCLRSGKGQVTFVDHKIVKKLMMDENERDNYMVVCQGESKPLDQTIFEDTTCHVGHVANPTVFIARNNTEVKKVEIKDLLRKILSLYSTTNPEIELNIFDSSVYECEPCSWTGKRTNKDLIFLEESTTLKIIDPSKVYAEKFFQSFNTCVQLQPKPRAKICVTTVEKYNSCLAFKDIAEKFMKVKDVAWGCVLANSSLECMQAVHNNTADLFQADPVETFIAGKEMLLEPLMSVHKNFSISPNHTFTRTLAVIKASSLSQFEEIMRTPEDQPKYIKDLWKLKTCHAGLKNVSSFHNPIGWLLSNGTIPRIGSVFESINRYFKSSCLPDVSDQDIWMKDLLLGHEHNWGYPTLNMYNFTGQDWLLWNTPATWNYLTYNRKAARSLNLAKLVELQKLNLTNPLLETVPEDISSLHMIDDIMGVEGLTDVLQELKTVSGKRETKMSIFRDRMSTSYPNIQGLMDQTLNSKVERLDAIREASRYRSEMREGTDLEFLNLIKEQMRVPLLTTMFSRLLEIRNEKIATLEELVAHVKMIPSMSDFQDKEITTILSHPAIMSYVQIYFPRLSRTFVEMFDNAELREREFNRYTNPLWLSPDYRKFIEVIQKQQNDINKTCHSNLPLEFSGYEGSMRCLKSGVADIAFFDEQALRNETLLARVGFTLNDLRLLCPNGQVVEIDPEMNITKVCNFGEVMNPALLTSYNVSGSHRWNITKALMHAHQSPAVFKMFGKKSLFGVEFDKLLPIDLLNQTHQTYLGPMVLRSFEAIIKPSSYDWFKDQGGVCYGETFTNVIKQRNDSCQAIIKDVTCVGTPRPKKISVGRFGEKKYMIVKMCSRPSKFVRKMAEFTCDNGYGYLAPVTTAVGCECVPCEEMIEFNATFTEDEMWKQETTKFTPLYPTFDKIYHNISIWGNNTFWYNHQLNRNFKLGKEAVVIEHIREVIQERPTVGILRQIDQRIDEEQARLMDVSTVTKVCEPVWKGLSWNKEWFPTKNVGTCVAPVTGERFQTRMERVRENFLRRSREQ